MKNVKIVTFVPLKNAAAKRTALGEAGAGALGDYMHCSYTLLGEGRFTPQAGAKPHIGQVGEPSVVEEARIEVVCERSKAKQVVSALRGAHPYEEPAFDIIALLDEEDL